MATNITMQLDRIVGANVQPGHVAYLSKQAMANVAQCLLNEYEDELHAVFLARLKREKELAQGELP